MNLFCLPFAGASKYSYNGFVACAPKNIKVIPIDLPGRGSRLSESLLSDIDLIVNDIFNQIKHLLSFPYAIYGHSMGSLTGYLLTKTILSHQLQKPVHLFFSGCIAPSIRKTPVINSSLPSDLFKRRLMEYGGIPEEVLVNDDLMKFFEPILRSDFKVVESFRYYETIPFNIPIDIFLGTEENASYEDVLAWQFETHAKISVSRFPGKHFFIFGREKEIMNIIASKAFMSASQVGIT
jgi:surfactin synthase thioesterase subunit